MPSRIEDLLPILRCPRTHTRLFLSDGTLVSEAGETYPIVNGKPILVKWLRDVHLNAPPPAKISQNKPSYVPPESYTVSAKRILHLGSGNVPCTDQRVISLDMLPCENADIVAEAEELPFVDDVFDHVDSGAVFEHLYEPLRAIREVKRTLKDGGTFRIDTAFLQSYHGFPDHYFNMTPLAIETFLADDFLLEESHVPGSATPVKTLSDLLDRFLSFLPTKEKTVLMGCSLRKVLEKMKADPGLGSELLASFSEYALRSMAASFVVTARKPNRWQARIQELERNQLEAEKWELAKREYYSMRIELILRHHEYFLYKRLAYENGAKVPPDLTDPPTIQTLLHRCKVADPLSLPSLDEAIRCLHQEEQNLTSLRDPWIRAYLEALERSKVHVANSIAM